MILRWICFVVGFVLEGFDLNHDPDSLQSVIGSTAEVLPEDKPRFIHGLYLPRRTTQANLTSVDWLRWFS